MRTSSFLLFSGLVLLACGSDDPPPADNTQSQNGTLTACEAAGTELCARACACATDGKCHLGAGTDGGTASINFDDEIACRNLYVVLGCLGGGEPGFDYARCESATRSAACVATAGGDGVLMPAECKVNRK